MRNHLQGSRSLRFSVFGLIFFAFLISLISTTFRFSEVFSQSFPTGNYTYYFPLIRTGEATPVGPVGGTFTSFAIDPGQNDNIYAGHYGSGVYKSFDQGTTWYRKSVGLSNLVIQSLATHPTSSNIVFAGTYKGGIYRSTNAGESWQSSNGGVLDNHIIYDIEIDPANPQRIFVVSRISGSLMGYLASSINGGLNWTVLYTGDTYYDQKLDYFYDVDIDPNNSNIVYLTAHEHGFYKSVNGGLTFSPINTGVTDPSARSFAIDNAYAGLVYGGVWHGEGIFRTWNGGASWVRSSAGLPMDVEVYRVYLDPFGRQQKRVFSCTYGNGLYSSDDFAASWVSRGLAGQRLYDFVIADGNPQRWYAATENNGILRSSSYGSNWNSVMADMRLTAITGLTVMPGEADMLAGAVYGQGVFTISDSGETWEPMNEGLTSLDVVSLALADEQLFAIGRGWMDVWNGQTWQAVTLPEAPPEDVEAGINWVRGRVLLPDEAIWNEVNSIIQPSGVGLQAGQLLLGTAGSGFWALRGDQWEQVGLETWAVQEMVQTPEGDVKVFACDKVGDCGVFNYDSSGLSKMQTSTEGDSASFIGLSGLPEGIGNFFSSDLTVASSQGDKCTWAVGGGTKLWTTKDCGVNWHAHSFEWTVQALAFDPMDAHVLIVGTRESGAFRLQVP